MKKEIINDDIEIILNEVANRYGLIRDKLVPIIGGYQNLVYEYIQNDRSYILRLSNSSTRNNDEINSELDWCLYLVDYGVPLSKPLSTLNGLMTELVSYNEIKITATLFEKARGIKLSYPEYLNNVEVFKELGRTTGRIHNASKEYVPICTYYKFWIYNEQVTG
ncbi:phosphotransferase [Tissierella sp. MB52-C2]|uniref:phosphotransferase enzyme family protein n=1 Tax=Tissierella sp. MB52-C2 TaxID=3070999 RepID=UPI00280C2376|nr:phosphotransferase [Tissierella sp. MB52-C2]WMM23789.1 phosphotransferase [Tissierella sp. MB52-C2]